MRTQGVFREVEVGRIVSLVYDFLETERHVVVTSELICLARIDVTTYCPGMYVQQIVEKSHLPEREITISFEDEVLFRLIRDRETNIKVLKDLLDYLFQKDALRRFAGRIE